MRIWWLSVLIGCLAGLLTPAAWWVLQFGGEFLSSNAGVMDGSESSLSYAVALPFGVAAILFLILIGFRGFRSADAFTYFISDLHFQDGKRKVRYSLLHSLGALLLLLGKAIVGIEGFAMELLSSLGSWMGTKAKLSTNQVRTLAGCGAAASIAAVLGQPTAAFLFVIELLYGWGNLSLSMGTYAVAAFVAASVSQSLTSSTGIFSSLFGTDGGLSLALRTDSFELNIVSAIFGAAAVSVAAALLASFSIWLHRKTDKELHDLFETRRATDVSRAAFGLRLVLWAGLTAVAIYTFPQALGAGVSFLHSALSNNFLLSVALLALLLRILMSAMAYSVLGSMGLVFPTLVAGGLLGASIAILAKGMIPVSSGTIALLTMGAFFSASFGTPVAATALVYGYATGLMNNSALFLFTALAANFGANFLCGLMQQDRMASMGLYRHGIRFRSGMCFNTLSGIQVRDAMITYISPVLRSSSIGEAYKKLMESKFSTLPVVDENGKMHGMVSLSDFYGLDTWKKLGEASQVHNLVGVDEMIRAARIRLHPDMNLETALRSMSDEDFVPVVEKDDHFLGLLVKSDLVNLYNKEVVKKAFRRG